MPRPRIPDDQRLVLLGIRVTPLQMQRLGVLCEMDGLPRQEHMRRALDKYLELMLTAGSKDPPPLPPLNHDKGFP